MFSMQLSFGRLRTSSFLRTLAGAHRVLFSNETLQVVEPCDSLMANHRTVSHTAQTPHHEGKIIALRTRKSRSQGHTSQHFLDMKQVKVQAGSGGDGAISFLHLWANEKAGPAGGDGGNGAHVIFETSADVTDLSHVQTTLLGEDGEQGHSKDMCGKSAQNLIVKVPVGTIIRTTNGKIVADLDRVGTMFVAARGGAGGHGNAFFKSDIEQAPQVCEYGARGEYFQYLLELRSMANVGLIGFPNAGKSTLLRAISRARPKVAPYPFTTLKPHLGIVQYDDYQQIAVADLPGLIPDSHKNKGLGITFLKHAERCAVLLFVLDMSLNEPWMYLEQLQFELEQFSEELCQRPMIVVANKIDLPSSKENLQLLRERTKLEIIPISAKTGTNLSSLLSQIRILHDSNNTKSSDG